MEKRVEIKVEFLTLGSEVDPEEIRGILARLRSMMHFSGSDHGILPQLCSVNGETAGVRLASIDGLGPTEYEERGREWPDDGA